jgi:hypothetical protein
MRPSSSTNFLSLQANVICLLLALTGSTIIIRHHEWFGDMPTATSLAPQHQVVR